MQATGRIAAPFASGTQRSAAKVQQCIFCHHPTTDAYGHVFADCAEWADHRSPPVQRILAQDHNLHPAVKLLQLHPPHKAWKAVVNWCYKIDCTSAEFWQHGPPEATDLRELSRGFKKHSLSACVLLDTYKLPA